MTFQVKTQKDLKSISEYICNKYTDGVIVLLKGNLGAGKSTFVKEFCSYIGVGNTSSPTFSIMNNYDDKVYHYDIYRTGSDEFFSLGVGEELGNKGFHFVEWADEKIKKFLDTTGLEYITMTITPKDNTREVSIHE